MKNIEIVVAMSKNRTIGVDNNLPWHLPKDLQHFKKITLNQSVLMGRKTFESIYKSLGKALPNRKNIVLTKDRNKLSEYSDIEIISNTSEIRENKIMVIGGEQIFKIFLPLANKIHLTIIEHEIVGDTFFPKIDNNEWHQLDEENHQIDDNHKYNFKFITLVKNDKLT